MRDRQLALAHLELESRVGLAGPVPVSCTLRENRWHATLAFDPAAAPPGSQLAELFLFEGHWLAAPPAGNGTHA